MQVILEIVTLFIAGLTPVQTCTVKPRALLLANSSQRATPILIEYISHT